MCHQALRSAPRCEQKTNWLDYPSAPKEIRGQPLLRAALFARPTELTHAVLVQSLRRSCFGVGRVRPCARKFWLAAGTGGDLRHPSARIIGTAKYASARVAMSLLHAR